MVDDDPWSLTTLGSILSANGFHVRVASTGAQALDSVSAEGPELILLDVRLPDMDGFDVYRRIKAVPGSAAIPVIFISGSADPGERAEGLALGAVDFVAKPVHRQELLARVETHLELSRLRARLETEVASGTAERRATIAQLHDEIADERAHAEQSLRESEARFRRIADAAPVLIWVSGLDKMCTFFNKGWLAFTGRTMEEELGNGWTEGVHRDDLERCMATYSSAFEARRSFQLEYRLRRADGEYRWVLDNGVPNFEGGFFAGYVGSCVDITDARQAQEARFDTGRLESLRMLTGGIAHDFGNLMSTILATAELASAEIDEGRFPRSEVENIGAVARRAIEMVRELMIYSGKDSGTFEPVDVSQVARDMVALLKTSVSKKAALESDLPSGLPPVWGNPTRIRQIVMNLVLNASEALERRGGVIRISTSRVTRPVGPDPVGGGRRPAGECLRLEVSDTGCGIAEAQLARIFDPYFTTKRNGHGLGLAVVHGIVKSHGGVINVKSAPDRGTTFEVIFPFLQNQAVKAKGFMHARM